MTYFVTIILGLTFGSFAGALVTRLKTGEGFVNARSRCDSCGHTLTWKDLVPVVSWLSLRGKCRYCSEPISPFNPLMELVMTVLFVVSVWQWDFSWSLSWLALALWLAIVVCMVAISAYDIKHFQVPMPVAYVMLGLGLALYVVNQINLNIGVAEAGLQLVSQLVAASVLIVLPWTISRGKWMGSGDIYLAALAGLVMTSAISSFAAVLSGFYLGALYVLPLMALKKVDRKSKIPFGPFILAGIFVWYLWELQLLEFVQSNLLLI